MVVVRTSGRQPDNLALSHTATTVFFPISIRMELCVIF